MKMGKKAIVKKTALVSLLLLLSKFLGFVREFFQIKFLGVGALSDAFNIAFKIPQVLRKIFAEGALSAAFVPTIIKVHKESEEQAQRLVTLTFLTFGSVILLLCFLVSLFPETIIALSAPGFINKPVEMAAAVGLIRILIYFVFFIFAAALLSGVLQAHMRFAAQSWGPTILNVFYIGGLLAGIYLGLTLNQVAYFILLGGLVQLLFYYVIYKRLGLSLLWPNRTTYVHLYQVMAKFIPCLASVGAIEINLWIDTQFASTLPAGSTTLLALASRFMTIALGGFAVAFTSVLFSHFSRVALYAPKRLSFYLLESTKLIFWVTVPVALLMSFFSYDIFYTIFYKVGHSFTLDQVAQASSLLIAFLAGLFFFSCNKMFLSIFYALHETRYSTGITFIGTGINVLLNWLLIGHYGATGIAVATSVAALIQSICFLLVLYYTFDIKFYYQRFFQFLAFFALHITLIGIIFLLSYKLIYTVIQNYLPAQAPFLLNHIGLWFWVGPLTLLCAGLLYISRKRGLYLYFL